MANSKTKSSISLTFTSVCDSGADDSKSISMELDEDRNIDGSCYLYGQKIYFRVSTLPEDLSYALTPSDGTINSEGQIEVEIEEEIQFEDSNEASTNKVIKLIQSMTWYGKDLGSLTKTGDNTVSASLSGVAIGTLKYTTDFKLYSITVPTREAQEWPVLIIAKESN